MFGISTSALPRGEHFNFLLTPMRGWVGVKLAGMGFFLVQSGRYLVVQKFIYLNLGLNVVNFGTTYFSFGAIYLNFFAKI